MYTSHTKSLLCSTSALYQQERIPEDGFTQGFVINEPSIPRAVFRSKHRKHGETTPVKLGHTTCNLFVWMFGVKKKELVHFCNRISVSVFPAEGCRTAAVTIMCSREGKGVTDGL